jgi:DNA excision repair protein ERCC-2
MAVAVYRTLTRGGRLFLAAPTGIGKTISALFPAVKALGEAKLERIFYLTARTVGRTIAEKACADLRRAGLKLRAVTLTARDKVCVRDGKPCDLLTCPLAIGYYDRVKPAIREALARGEIHRAALDEISQRHQVCPFELSLDVSVWCDAVICDYNYVFDPQVYLRRHFGEGDGQSAFLVDEAHNLADRAREMFSAELESGEIRAVRRMIRPAVPRCARALTGLLSELQQLAGSSGSGDEAVEPSDAAGELNLFPANAPAPQAASGRTKIRRDLSPALIERIEDALAAAEVWLAKNLPADFREALLALYFRLHAFLRTAGLYDARYVTMIEAWHAANLKVRLFCVDPSVLLRQALERGRAGIFFSATLAPVDYYRTLLGGESHDPFLELASPFPPEHLAVLVQDRIQTQFKNRAESLVPVATAIQTLIHGRPGNYLVYFPSYQYLNDVLQEFKNLSPTTQVLVQRPGMTEAERDQFLHAFGTGHEKTLVGFAVMGGVFGEGVDLVGERLIGAAIVGVGLPQLCAERDLIRDYFQTQNQPGFEFAYTFPGMNRVLQAIGRVIRSESDRGVVLLIDSRFNEPRYRRLFPPWWKSIRVRSDAALAGAVREFWERPA